MGTFLVRSGVLTSVHAFAVDPTRGIFILAILMLFTGGGLALFALRASDCSRADCFTPISREGSLVLNNLLLVTSCRDGARRHALSDGARRLDGRQDLGRTAVLQHDVRTADGAAASGAADRTDAGVEARRSCWA